MSIDTVEKLVTALDDCTTRRDYVKIASDLDLDSDELEDYSSWSEERYTRNCIARTDDYELLLLCWEEGQDTPIHCHGGEECWVNLVDGEITEDRFEIPEQDAPLLDHTSVMKPGDVSYMNDEMGIHQLKNTSSDRTMTLHLYVKPIDECRVFSDEDGSVLWKKLQYDTIDESVTL